LFFFCLFFISLSTDTRLTKLAAHRASTALPVELVRDAFPANMDNIVVTAIQRQMDVCCVQVVMRRARKTQQRACRAFQVCSVVTTLGTLRCGEHKIDTLLILFDFF
jgi:hypothetical protein